MAKKRLYELARELGLESRAVLERAHELGIEVKTASSGLDPAAERQVRESYGSAAAPESGSEPGLKIADIRPRAEDLQTALDRSLAEIARLNRQLMVEPLRREPRVPETARTSMADLGPDTATYGAPTPRRVFVVHGHDESAKNELERFLMDVGLEPIVLHRQADRGMTIIEKLEAHSDVGFAVIILTPDEVAYVATEESKDDADRAKVKRARPNVILEFGYFLGRLGRGSVCCLYTGGVALPSDMSGILYKPYAAHVKETFSDLRKELIAAGYSLMG